MIEKRDLDYLFDIFYCPETIIKEGKFTAGPGYEDIQREIDLFGVEIERIRVQQGLSIEKFCCDFRSKHHQSVFEQKIRERTGIKRRISLRDFFPFKREEFPKLYEVVCCCIAIIPSSACIERYFSNVKFALRANLKIETLFAMLQEALGSYREKTSISLN
ncbi:hypothetical protein EIN_416030 [Entamoeba invadens IP1]|nr:hypothetical protein EIN_416030 [Entamoeba invadens IP1]ELP95352.1 hypothetical protein EIN_416030 [Entamoeba invadens IP1]|eukprot:XP_004262123.1 hypothetical protein EIN_416030 [Entamoeba invadens IP1]